MRRILLPIMLLLAALAAPAHAEPRNFKLVGGQVIVTVTLNGSEIPALLDTGAAQSLISLDLASEHGVRTQRASIGRTLGVSGKGVAYGRTRRVALDFGAGPIRRSIGTLPAGNDFADEGVRLLIGMDLLASMAVSLDFQTMTANFQRSSAFTPPNEPSLPMTRSGWNRPTLTVDLAGVPANLLLDTAASPALHLDSAFVAEAEELNTLSTSSVRILGIDGAGQHDAIIVPRVTLGEQVFKNVPATLASFKHLKRGSTEIDGLVGVKLLKQFNWMVDFGNLRVWMTPHATVPQ